MVIGDINPLANERGPTNGWICHLCGWSTRLEAQRLLDIESLVIHGKQQHRFVNEALNDYVHNAQWVLRDREASKPGQFHGQAGPGRGEDTRMSTTNVGGAMPNLGMRPSQRLVSVAGNSYRASNSTHVPTKSTSCDSGMLPPGSIGLVRGMPESPYSRAGPVAARNSPSGRMSFFTRTSPTPPSQAAAAISNHETQHMISKSASITEDSSGVSHGRASSMGSRNMEAESMKLPAPAIRGTAITALEELLAPVPKRRRDQSQLRNTMLADAITPTRSDISSFNNLHHVNNIPQACIVRGFFEPQRLEISLFNNTPSVSTPFLVSQTQSQLGNDFTVFGGTTSRENRMATETPGPFTQDPLSGEWVLAEFTPSPTPQHCSPFMGSQALSTHPFSPTLSSRSSCMFQFEGRPPPFNNYHSLNHHPESTPILTSDSPSFGSDINEFFDTEQFAGCPELGKPFKPDDSITTGTEADIDEAPVKTGERDITNQITNAVSDCLRC